MGVKLLFVGGARPNFMKLAPLLRAVSKAPEFSAVLVHSGQHYDDRMSGQFFRDLGMPQPDFSLEVGSGSHAAQTAEVMRRIEPVMESARPDGVVVVGDVNSTLAAALVAGKLQIPVVHVEAGLRSFDRKMPEEINRLATDAISDLLLVTEDSGRRNLLHEGVPESRIHFVGNLMVDSLLFHLDRAERESTILERTGASGSYALLTLHRPSNVDDEKQLRVLMEVAEDIAHTFPVYFPVHPRTRSRMETYGIVTSERIHLLEPLGYLDFVRIMAKSALVLTDSGGIQEETTALGIPCLTLRENTERPVTVEEGTNILAGVTRESILAAWAQTRANPKQGRVPKFWDGRAAERCVDALRTFYGDAAV